MTQGGGIVVSFDIGVRNLAYCVARTQPGALPVVLRWCNVDLLGNQRGGSAVDALLRELDAIVYGDDAAGWQGIAAAAGEDGQVVVLVENQPSKGCKIMSVIQVTIGTYFRVLQMYRALGRVSVRAVSPKSKGSLFAQPANMCQAGRARTRRNQNYRHNKQAAIAAVTAMLQHGTGFSMDSTLATDIRNMFLGGGRRPKLDDLSDCLLQMLSVQG